MQLLISENAESSGFFSDPNSARDQRVMIGRCFECVCGDLAGDTPDCFFKRSKPDFSRERLPSLRLRVTVCVYV